MKRTIEITFSAAIVLFAASAQADPNAGTVTICHRPPGNPYNFQTITVSADALDAHFAHYDLNIPCENAVQWLCEDWNPCTIDVNPDTGRCYPADKRPPTVCDDGDPCTTDSCGSWGCQATPKCPDGQWCLISDGSCVDAPTCSYATDPNQCPFGSSSTVTPPDQCGSNTSGMNFYVSLSITPPGGSAHHCAGALINATTVVTTAHCVASAAADGTGISASVGGASYSLTSVVKHPAYADGNPPVNDIAVLHLNGSVPDVGGSYITLAPKDAPSYEGVSSLLLGNGGPLSGDACVLDGVQPVQQSLVPIINNTDCSSMTGLNLSDGNICAHAWWWVWGGPSLCTTDEGGPFMSPGNMETLLTGLQGARSPCGDLAAPIVGTRISTYHDWILSN
jgi:hypothetical protein